MKVKLLKTGEAAEFDDGYAARLIEQGKAVRVEEPKTKEKPELKKAEIPEEVADDLRQKEAEIARLSQQARDAVDNAIKLRQENSKIKRRFDETDLLLQQTQELLDNSQRQLNSLQSAKKLEDDGDTPRNELTLEAFSDAVARFTSTCARLPYMRNAFAVMDDKKRGDYDTLLKTMEGWCAGARKALDTIMLGGMVIE